jgi:sortase A
MAVAQREVALDDVRVLRIPWRRVLAGVLVALGVLAAWFVTTNTYATLWQQRLADRWAATVASGGSAAVPASGEPVARLSVPDVGLDRVVVEGVDVASLRKAPGHDPASPLPGEEGNAVIRGHRVLWSGPFREIGTLNFGAPVYVQLADGSVRTYLVAGIFHMNPQDPTIAADEGQRDMITLVTSHPPLRADRVLVVKAVLPPGEAA